MSYIHQVLLKVKRLKGPTFTIAPLTGKPEQQHRKFFGKHHF